jgi:hypothetical protein
MALRWRYEPAVLEATRARYSRTAIKPYPR